MKNYIQIFLAGLFLLVFNIMPALAQNQPSIHLVGHSDGVGGLLFTPDNKYVMSVSVFTPDILVWDVQTGQFVKKFTDKKLGNKLSISKNGKILVRDRYSGYTVWDFDSGKVLISEDLPDKVRVEEVAVSDDGTYLVLGIKDEVNINSVVKVFDITNKAEVCTFKITPKKKTASIYSICISPDKKTIACSCYWSYYDNYTQIWDTKSGKKVKEWKRIIDDLYFSDDGSKLYGIERGSIVELDINTDYPRDKVYLCVPSENDIIHSRNLIGIWGKSAGSATNELFSRSNTFKGLPYYWKAMAISNDGTLVAGTDGEMLMVWDYSSTRTLLSQYFNIPEKKLGFDEKGNITSENPALTLYQKGGYNWVAISRDGRFDCSEEGLNGLTLETEKGLVQCTRNMPNFKRGLASTIFPNENFQAIYKTVFSNSSSSENNANLLAQDFLFDVSPRLVIDPYGHSGEVMDMAFTPDGKSLLSVSRDKTLRLWDVETGENLKTYRGSIGDGVNGELYRLAISPEDNMVAVGGFLNNNKWFNVGDIRFFDLKTGRMRGVMSKAYNSITCMGFSKKGERFAFGSNDKFFRVINKNYLEGILKNVNYKNISTNSAFQMSDEILACAISADGERVVQSTYNYKTPYWLNITGLTPSNGPKEVKELPVHHEGEIVAIAFTPDDQYYITAENSKAVVWDREGNYVRDLGKVNTGARDGDISFSRDGSWVLIGNTVYEFATGAEISKCTEHGVKVNAYSSLDVAAIAQGELIHLWDPKNGKITRTLGPQYLKVEGIGFVGNGLKIAVSGKTPNDLVGKSTEYVPEDIINVFDFETLKILEQKDANVSNNLKFDNQGVKLARIAPTAEGENLATIDYGSAKINADASLGVVSTFTILPSGDAIIGTPTHLRSFDASGNKVKDFVGHSGTIKALAISPDGKYLASLAEDHVICLWNLTETNSTVTPVARLTLFNQGEWICIGRDNYYTSSKRGGRYAGFHINQDRDKEAKFYPFQQLDAQLNRPDLVLKSVGVNNPELEKAFYAAYLKRLSKLGLSESTIGKDFNLPSVQIITEPHTTSAKIDTVEIVADDNLFNLNRIIVSVNEVPIHGPEGISLNQSQVKQISYKIPITLSQGRNKIQVSVINEKGGESPREQLIVFQTSTAKASSLYVLAIGVSDYLDNDFDLKYAAKDANDLSALLQTKNATAFDQVKVMNIANQDATRENILKAKEFLMQSGVDDEVVLFVAGHGLLDEKMDWYFATHDIDFSNPSIRGLKYDELEGLLAGIPARKKLMMVDACHSGEVDKAESALVTATPVALSANIKSRGFKSKMVVQNPLGLQNSFEMMQQLFADLSNGSGAMVISSAGGAEYAFESPQWNNGVFTYSVLEGLKTGNADKNKDKTITVTELRDYVIAKVQALTNGKQTPTSRKENIEFDFKVW